jgi:chromosome segregation ATPase
MYPVEEEEKTKEQIEWEKEAEKEFARQAKRQEDAFKADCDAIRKEKGEVLNVVCKKPWVEFWGEKIEKELESLKETLRLRAEEGKELLKEWEGIQDKVGPAIARAEKLRKQAEDAQREADELQGRASALPIYIRSQAKTIQEARWGVEGWEARVQHSLDSIRSR